MSQEHILKRCFELAVSGALFLFDQALALLARAFGQAPAPRCVVLYYHAIPSELRAKFIKQMDMLVRWAKPIEAGNTSALVAGSHYAAVTFDDAFENVASNALPTLTARKIPATIFVVTGCLGKLPHWMSMGADEVGKTMTLDQLLNLPPDLITVGSHTTTHPNLTSISDEGARNELVESRVTLERMLGRNVNLFSFPHGAHNPKLLRTCREAGYDRVFTIRPILGLKQPHEFATGRILVDPSDWPVEFCLKLLGAYRWLDLASVLKRSLLSGGFLRRFFGLRPSVSR